MPLCEDCGNYFEKRGKAFHGLHLCATCYEIRSRDCAELLEGIRSRGVIPSAQSYWTKLRAIWSTIDRVRYEKYKKCMAELAHARSPEEIDKALLQLYRFFGYKTELLKEIMRIGASLKATLVDKKVDE